MLGVLASPILISIFEVAVATDDDVVVNEHVGGPGAPAAGGDFVAEPDATHSAIAIFRRHQRR